MNNRKKTGFSLLIILGLLSTLLCNAQEFDLNYLPADREETDAVNQRMLDTGTQIAYRTDHENQKLWIFTPDGLKKGELRPCIFFIHGGGWGGSPSSLAPQCLYLARRGMVGISIHFRSPSVKTGITPKDCLADCLSAYRWVKQNAKAYHIDPERIVVSGGSAGGHLSLAMLTISGCDNPADDLSVPIDPKAFILFNPAMDLVEGWKGGASKCEEQGIDPASFSPAHYVKPGLPETLILSGEKDGVISPAMIRKFMERMEKNGNKCSFVEFPEVGHGFFNYGREDNIYFQKTMIEVEKFLTGLGYLPSLKNKVERKNQTVTYVGMNGEQQQMEIYFPESQNSFQKLPCAIFFHGGGWTGGNLEQFRPFAEYLSGRGMVCVTANYSMRKKTDDGKIIGVSEGESRKRICVIDGKSVIRWVKQHSEELGIDPNRIVSGGASAGGHIAVLSMMDDAFNNPNDPLDITTEVQAFLLFCPAFTLLEKDNIPDLNVFKHLNKNFPPALFLVGETDNWRTASDALVAKLAENGSDVENWMAKGIGHMFFRTEDWMDVCLKNADDFLVERGFLEGESQIVLEKNGEYLINISGD